MANFTQVECSSIRETASNHLFIASKLETYASNCTDPQIKQMFTTSAQGARTSAKKLTDML